MTAAARNPEPEWRESTGQRPPDMPPAEALRAFARMLARHAAADQDRPPKEG